MPKFGNTSKRRLATCDEDLQELFQEVVKFFDCSILEGHRNEETQNKYFDEGKSQVKWPNGKHNSSPSTALDAAPYPIDWDDDTDVKETKFKDLVHFELRRS